MADYLIQMLRRETKVKRKEIPQNRKQIMYWNKTKQVYIADKSPWIGVQCSYKIVFKLKMSIIKNNVSTGSSLWQPQHGIASANELQGWRTVASRLAFDSQLRKMEENQCANEDGCYRKSLFSTDISVRNPAAKMKQYPFDRQQEQLGNSKWYSYKTLPPAELLPRNEVMGGYIFVCNNETMQEDLRRQLFGNLSQSFCLTELLLRSLLYSMQLLQTCFWSYGESDGLKKWI